MKRILLLMGLLVTLGSLRAQVKEYTITSTIEGLQDSSFYITIWNGGSQARSSKGSIINGQIQYTDTTSTDLIIRLTLSTKKLYKEVGRGYIPVKSQSIWLVASPGKTIHLTGELSDFAEVYPSADKENKILTELTRAYHPLLNASANIAVKLANNSKSLDTIAIKELEDRQAVLDDKAKKVMNRFLHKHPSSIVGLYYMNDMLLRNMISVEQVEELLSKVEKKYRNTAYYTTVANRVDGSRYDVGRAIFNISSRNTYDGKYFTTESWKGKFYLIDFWGSWCGPCLADVPDLKKLKAEYATQLNILGIASDKEPNWRKAIADLDLNWVQILNGPSSQDFVSRLNVTGFPTKILVDPEGNIVYRSSGGGETSFQKIAEIIKKWNNK